MPLPWPLGVVDALIPMKRLDQAKSRLSAYLEQDQRVRLMEVLVGNAARAVRGVAEIQRVILVSSDPRSPSIAAAHEIEHFDDRGLAWNDALAAAMTEAVTAPTALVLSADLPLVATPDVEAFLAAAPRPGVAIARATDAGTNGVVMTPPGAAATCFGVKGSAARHAELAHDAGLTPRIVDIPALALDVDSLEDVETVLAHAVPEELRALLRPR